MGLGKKPVSRFKSGGNVGVTMSPKNTMKSMPSSKLMVKPGQTLTISTRKVR